MNAKAGSPRRPALDKSENAAAQSGPNPDGRKLKTMTTKLSTRARDCPLEQRIVRALDSAGIEYATENEGSILDFYLFDYGVHIEVKAAHSPRIASQMKRSKYVIAVQGVRAVEFLARLIESGGARELKL